MDIILSLILIITKLRSFHLPKCLSEPPIHILIILPHLVDLSHVHHSNRIEITYQVTASSMESTLSIG
jgi:hypothetical protein